MSLVYKLRAFLVHGFQMAWSYKLNFVARYVSGLVSVVMFYFLDLYVQPGSRTIPGGDYFAFVLIGGAFSRYMELAMRSFSLNLRDQLLMGTIEPLVSTAVSMPLALLGPSIWTLLEGTVLVSLQLIFGVVLGADFSQANWPAAIVVAGLGVLSVLCYGVFSAAFTMVFKSADPINWLIASTAYVFSGVFFPVSVMPAWLRVISYALPFTYVLRALRGALLEGAGLVELRVDILSLLVFTLILSPLALWSMSWAVRYLKRTGKLAHY